MRHRCERGSRLLQAAMRQKIHGFDPERDEKKLMSL